jgi:hypothetical protein
MKWGNKMRLPRHEATNASYLEDKRHRPTIFVYHLDAYMSLNAAQQLITLAPRQTTQQQ